MTPNTSIEALGRNSEHLVELGGGTCGTRIWSNAMRHRTDSRGRLPRLVTESIALKRYNGQKYNRRQAGMRNGAGIGFYYSEMNG